MKSKHKEKTHLNLRRGGLTPTKLYGTANNNNSTDNKGNDDKSDNYEMNAG